VRVTVRPLSSTVFDLLRHLEREGCWRARVPQGLTTKAGILTFIEGRGPFANASQSSGGGDLPNYVWRIH